MGRKFTIFALFYFKYKPPGGLYSEGQFNGGFFALRFWGGLYLEGLIFGILRYENQAFYVDRGKSPFSRKTIIHLIYPSKFCITNFSSVLFSSQKKSKTMVIHYFFFLGGGGWEVNKVQYGPCENGQSALFCLFVKAVK